MLCEDEMETPCNNRIRTLSQCYIAFDRTLGSVSTRMLKTTQFKTLFHMLSLTYACRRRTFIF